MTYLNQGGPLMYPLLILFIIILLLIVKGVFKNTEKQKLISTISTLGLFSMVLGFFAQILGFIGAFESIALAGDISPSVLANGLIVSYIAPIFGILIFFTSQIGKLILLWTKNKNEN
ncbi:MAG: hypothetical protein COB60_00005 [Flavobacteriaceae bacterium]|nr:MAG: hypothetical protein COB60_00005 [Flavobacteriaceae bacterium]